MTAGISRRAIDLAPFLLTCLLGIAGCGGDRGAGLASQVVESVLAGPDVDVLRIATTWARPAQQTLEREFQSRSTGPKPVKIVWIDVTPGTRLGRVCNRVLPVDVVLGGPVTEYLRLDREGRLEPVDGSGSRGWVSGVWRQATPGPAGATGHDVLALDDPRVDPPTLAWFSAELRQGKWSDGYARLVELAARASCPTGWQSGSAAAALQRGEAQQGLAVTAAVPPDPLGSAAPAVPFREGAAVLRGSRHGRQARLFLSFLVEHHGAGLQEEASDIDPGRNDLLADLLGSVLVDARDELLIASKAMPRADDAAVARIRGWLTEPPPWPPASIGKLQAQGGESALGLLQELTRQIVPDPQVRLWLVQSWLQPARPIDEALLEQLASAEDGRLVREPRFRAWLRAEWTAWARQRYRRIARLASGRSPAGKPEPARSP